MGLKTLVLVIATILLFVLVFHTGDSPSNGLKLVKKGEKVVSKESPEPHPCAQYADRLQRQLRCYNAYEE